MIVIKYPVIRCHMLWLCDMHSTYLNVVYTVEQYKYLWQYELSLCRIWTRFSSFSSSSSSLSSSTILWTDCAPFSCGTVVRGLTLTDQAQEDSRSDLWAELISNHIHDRKWSAPSPTMAEHHHIQHENTLEDECVEAFRRGNKCEVVWLLSLITQPAAVTTDWSIYGGVRASLLHYAAYHSWQEVVCELVTRYNRNVNYCDSFGLTALQYATRRGHL